MEREFDGESYDVPNVYSMVSKYDDKPFKDASARIFKKAHRLRKELTTAEDLLWQELRNKKLPGLRFRRQHPINDYVADFYCCEKGVDH